MNRLLKLQKYLLDEIEKYCQLIPERDSPPHWEKAHMASCARLGYLIALRRGINTDLASCACACHDYGRIITGKQSGHAEAGYEPVKEFLKRTELFNDEEIEIIATAVKNHSSKALIQGPVDEIVKDADVLDFHMYGYELPRAEQRERLNMLIGKIEKVLA